ncbi:MAG TPA: hypothetical protein VHW09_22740 [Bryobacteraceae bacterium]|nr:hypothetical protein [Bryobacteraceae bacterium]
MRLMVVLLLVWGSLFPVAARNRKVWLPATVGFVNADQWCKQAGSCGVMRGFGPSGRRTPVGPEVSAAAVVGPEVGPAPVPPPVTEIIQINSAKTSYLVKCEFLGSGPKFGLGTAIEFVIEGKYLYLRQSGNEYKTNILAVANRQ